MKPLSRRDFLKVGGLAVLGTAGATALTQDKNNHAALKTLDTKCILPMPCNKAIMVICLEQWVKYIMKRTVSTQPTL